MKYNIPELTFVYATEYSEAYVIKENGFRPMILLVDVLNKEFFINYRKYSYKEQSEITKAVYDFQNEDIEEGYKEDALIFRKLLKSNYKSIVEKMLNSLDEKKQLFCDKIELLPLVPYRDFRNEDGTYDEIVLDTVKSYNDLVIKNNKKYYKQLIEKLLNEDTGIHIPSLIERLKNCKPEKKELFCDKVKYEGKTLEEKLDSKEYKKFIDHCEDLCNRPFLPFDVFDFKESSPSFKTLKVETCDAEPYFKKTWYYGAIDPAYESEKVHIKQITPDIQHIITPSKNYFLFKLS